MPPVDFERFTELRNSLQAVDEQLADVQRRLSALRNRQAAAQRAGAADLLAIKQDIMLTAEELERRRGERGILAAGIDAVSVEVFRTPDELMALLSAKYPVALLPVRIETRFVNASTLQIRVYPDQIHVHSFQPAVTEAEAAAARAYWTTAWRDLERADDAWKALAASLTPERAKYVADRLRPEGFGSPFPADEIAFPAVDTVAIQVASRPQARLLPSRWFVSIQGPNDRPLYNGWFENPVLQQLPVSPFGDPLDLPPWDGEDALPPGDPAWWLIDFGTAVEAGMATTVALPAGQNFAQGISRLVVVGVDFSRTPGDAAAALAQQLVDHGHSDGFGVIRAGVPTNNTSRSQSDFRGADRDRAATIAAGAEGTAGPDLPRFLTALGVPDWSPSFAGFPGADGAYETTVEAVHTALWGTSFGFFLGHMLSPLVPDATVKELRRFIRDHVRPAGPFPALRVGKQPYGVIPVIPRGKGRLPDAEELRHGFPRALTQMLERMRNYIEFGDVRGPNGEALKVRSLDTIPNLVHQPPGTTSAEVLADILKMGPLAVRAFVRPTAAPEVGANSDKPLSRAVEAHRNIVFILLATLGFPPSSLQLTGKMPPLVDMVVQSWPRLALRTLPWVAEDLDAPGVMSHAVAKIRSRIDDAAASGASADSILTIQADEAASLFEGLVMLSGAYEYWKAGEDHIKQYAVEPEAIVGLTLSEELLAVNSIAGVQDAATAGYILETPRDVLDLRAGPATGDDSMLAYLDRSAIGEDPLPAVLDVRAYREALDVLETRPALEVDRALRGLLDLCSHRLDAYITGNASKKLNALRAQTPNGIHLGAYGIVHDLRVEQTPDSEGFVHVPSIDHAVTASILRSGHMANRDDDPNAFAVRLTSERVRNALHVSDGMAQGQPPSALLGYRFERWLIEDRLRAKYIKWLRKIAPHPSDGGPSDLPTESIAARDVVDGVALAQSWMRDRAGLLQSLGTLRGQPVPDLDRPALEGFLDRLVDLFDSFCDLWTTEAVHQLVRGNTARSAAAMAVIDRQEKPADPQVVLTSRGTWGYAQRVLWIANPAAAVGWPEDAASKSGPAANAIAAEMIGPPGRFIFSIHILGEDGQPHPTEPLVALPLIETGLSPLSLIMLVNGKTREETTPLEERIAARIIADRPGLRGAGIQLEAGPPSGAAPGVLGYEKLWALLHSVRRALIGRRALTQRDFAIADGPKEDGIVLAALADRTAAVRASVDAVRADLEQGLAGDILVDREQVLAALGAAGALNMPVPGWALIEGDNPVPDDILLDTGRMALSAIVRIADAWDTPTSTDPAEADVNRIRSVFGKDFPVLPEVTLVPGSIPEWTNSLADQAALAGGGGRGVLTRWRRAMSMVRPQMRALMSALDAAAWTANEAAGEGAAIVQFPHVPGARWAGLPFAEDEEGTLIRPNVSMSAVVFGKPEIGDKLCGVLIDEWTEAIPERDTTTSISFQYDAPAARPPQSIVLAVNPGEGVGAWSAGALVEIANETLDLAQLRLITPQNIPGAGAVLPTSFVPTNLTRQTPSWDFYNAVPQGFAVLGKA